MTSRTMFLSILAVSLLFSTGAQAVTVIENGGGTTIIRSETRAVSETGNNTGGGTISTGSASAKAVSETRVGDDGQPVVKVEAKAAADGQEASVDAIQEGPGTVSVEEREDGAEAGVEVSVSGDSVPVAPAEEGSGAFGKVGAFFAGIGEFIRSIFE